MAKVDLTTPELQGVGSILQHAVQGMGECAERDALSSALGKVAMAQTEPGADALTFTVLAQVTPLLDMVEHNRKVVRLMGEDFDTRAEGIARSLGSFNGGFGRKGEDIRDMFLRVTLRSGFEAFWPVRDLMPEIAAHTFVAYDWA